MAAAAAAAALGERLWAVRRRAEGKGCLEAGREGGFPSPRVGLSGGGAGVEARSRRPRFLGRLPPRFLVRAGRRPPKKLPLPLNRQPRRRALREASEGELGPGPRESLPALRLRLLAPQLPGGSGRDGAGGGLSPFPAFASALASQGAAWCPSTTVQAAIQPVGPLFAAQGLHQLRLRRPRRSARSFETV